MFLGPGLKVVYLIGIGLQIIQFLGRFGFPKTSLDGVEFAGVIQVMPGARGGRGEHVVDVLAVYFMRHVIADVDVAFVAYHADHVVLFIHATAEAVVERLLRRGVFTHEGMALHVLGWFLTGEAQKRGSKINEAHESVAFAAGFVIGRCQMLPLLGHI